MRSEVSARGGRRGTSLDSLTLRLASCLLALLAAACDRQHPGSTTRPPSPPAAAPLFTEAATACDLVFEHHNGARGRYYLPEIMGAGCALFDHDGDGDLDVYAVQGTDLDRRADGASGTTHRNRLFRNELRPADGPESKLFFTDVTATAGVGDTGYGMGCAVGDYDNDGFPDLYVTNFGANVLYHNRGDGTFTDVTARAGVGDPGFSASAAFLDFDRDGDLDLFVTNYVEFSVVANRECTRLGGQRDYCGPLSYEPKPDSLFRNDGDGTFADVSVASGVRSAYGNGLGVVCADFDGDGWIDIFVANDASPNQLWMNRGDGSFEDRALFAGVAVNGEGRNEAGMGVALGDFDRDGDDDLFLTHEKGETNTLYRNLGGGLFEDASFSVKLAAPSLLYAGFGTGWLDHDNDGWLDLFAANGAVRKLPEQTGEIHPFRQPDQFFRNASGRFIEATALLPALPAAAGRGAAFGDVDNDGDIDLLVANNGGPLRVLLNETPRTNGWVRLLLEGSRSNRDAYGARVTLEIAGGVRLVRTVGTDGSYCSASDKRLHFGLGAAKEIRFIEVRWPRGRVERWKGLALARQSTLREGDGEDVR